MDFSFSDSQTVFQHSVERYCSEHYDLSNRAMSLNKQGSFDKNRWRDLGKLGWLGASLPIDAHGAGGSIIEAAIILELFGRHLVGLPYVEQALIAGHILSKLAKTQEINDLLFRVVNGETIISLAHREIAGDGDIHFVQTSVKPTESGLMRLDGRKSIVVGGANADQFIISARIKGDNRDRQGICLFLLPKDVGGLVLRNFRLLDGTEACDLILDNCLVDYNKMVSGPEDSTDLLKLASDLEDVGYCSEALGIVENTLWTTRNYLRDRRQYGSALASFQALQHRMADMFVEVELARSTLLHALSMIDYPDHAHRHLNVVAARIHIGNCARYVCKEAIQLHGAMGMVEDNIIGKYFKRICAVFGQKGGLAEQLDRLCSREFVS